jgi:hypothetical protein
LYPKKNNNNNKELHLITNLIQAKEDFTVRITLDGFCSKGKTLQGLLSFYGFEQRDALGNNSLEIHPSMRRGQSQTADYWLSFPSTMATQMKRSVGEEVKEAEDGGVKTRGATRVGESMCL